MDEKKEYRITIERPIDGRQRQEGDTVWLSKDEFENEKGWGGLEEVKPKKAAAAGKPAAAEQPE